VCAHVYVDSKFSKQTAFGSSVAKEAFSIKTDSISKENKSVQSTRRSSAT